MRNGGRNKRVMGCGRFVTHVSQLNHCFELGVKEKHTIAGMGGSEEVADRQTHIRISSNSTCMLVSIHKNI